MPDKSLLVVVYTKSLEQDDRVRKEICSLKGKYNIEIIVFLESNTKCNGITSYGVRYQSIRLLSRLYLPSGKFLFVKALEIFLRTVPIMRRFNFIWCHEESMFLFPLLIKSKKIFWDLHELPDFFLKSKFKKLIFNLCEKNSYLILHANYYRVSYLEQNNILRYQDKHIALRNFPDSEFVESELLPINYDLIIEFLGGDEYVYLQGVQTSSRYPYQSISSILKNTELKLIVVGGFDENIKLKLETEFKGTFTERVFFAGYLNQLETPVLIRGSKFSIVFYFDINANEYFCEPNRFFQCLSLGIPVVVGANPPMSEIVEKFKCGIAILSDGSNQLEVDTAIMKLIANYDYYKLKTIEVQKDMIWDMKDFFNKTN
jgi:hypothetical protein